MRNKFTAGERVTVTFTAIVDSMYKNNFTYQWQKRQNRLPDKVSSVNGAVLTIPKVLKSDEGRYYCNVTNEWGRSMKSKDVTLSVKGKKSCVAKCIAANGLFLFSPITFCTVYNTVAT